MTELTLAAFQAALQTRFRVQPDAGAEVELVLAEARTPRSAAGSENFPLLFRDPAHPFLSQRTYPFRHETLGRFDLFIVPVGRDQKGFQYEAVFNPAPARG